MADHNYTADSTKSLDWKEHIRLRPGMYIGKLGDGSSDDDGIYVLLKEVLDNCIDEFVMGFGKQIEDDCDGYIVTVRDHGRGIPLEKLLDCSSKINTGAKYDSEAFKKSVGLNGVGIKAVNALSKTFNIQSFRDGDTRRIEYSCGEPVCSSLTCCIGDAHPHENLSQVKPHPFLSKENLTAYRGKLIRACFWIC